MSSAAPQMTPEEQAVADRLIGRRVLLTSKHSWAGCSGTIVRVAHTPFWGWRPVVRLDDANDVPHGHECFIIDNTDFVWEQRTKR